MIYMVPRTAFSEIYENPPYFVGRFKTSGTIMIKNVEQDSSVSILSPCDFVEILIAMYNTPDGSLEDIVLELKETLEREREDYGKFVYVQSLQEK